MTYLPTGEAKEIGFDPERLQRAYDLLAAWTKPNAAGVSEVSAGAICVGRHGTMIAPRLFGRMGTEPDAAPIRDDGMFLLASITKPIVYFGAMLLVERGLLNLTDKVTKYLPEFAAHHKEETLVWHLFTHTSGLPDMLANNMELRKAHAPLSKFVEHAMRDTVPLFPPGTRVSYQSMGTLLVAEIVRLVSGLPIAEFLQREIFTPLGLKSIALGAAGFERARLVNVETPADQDPTCGWNSSYWRELGAPWGGMLSSPADYAVLCGLMLGRGAVKLADGREVRLAAPATVAAMTRNQLVNSPDLTEWMARTRPWGLGWRLNHPVSEDCYGDLLSPAAFGHHGATGTLVWMDPTTEAFCVLFTTATQMRRPWLLKSLSNAVAAAVL
jgi:CubicO group peptidase (beta-lactamase class C family)